MAERLREAIVAHWGTHLHRLRIHVVRDGSGHLPAPEATWWLECFVPESATLLQRASEGVALLRILGKMDFKELVLALVDLKLVSPWVSASASRSRSAVGLAVIVKTPDHLHVLSACVSGTSPVSDKFKQVVGGIATSIEVDPRIQVVVHVSDESSEPDRRQEMLRLVTQLASLHHCREEASTVCKAQRGRVLIENAALIRVLGVNFSYSLCGLLEVDLLTQLMAIVKHGVRVLNFQSLDLAGDDLSLLPLPEFFHVFLPGPGSPNYSDVKSIILSDATPVSLVPAVLSALHTNTSIENLVIESKGRKSDVAEEEIKRRQHLWRWIAFAVFSPSAQHRIRDLRIDFAIARCVDFECIQGVTTSSNPLAVLFDSDKSVSPKPVTASTFHLQNAHLIDNTSNVNEPSGHKVFHSPVPLRIFTTGVSTKWGDLTQVLLPGYGLAWVESANADCTHGDTNNRSSSALFRSLTLDNLAVGASISLLRALPCSVRSIEIGSVADTSPLDDWCRAVFPLFPRLKRLELSNNAVVKRLNTFPECAMNGTCKLSELVVSQKFPFDSEDVKQFLMVLGDASHPLTASLDQLELHLTDQIGYRGDLRLLRADFDSHFHRMLNNNRGLCKVTLVLLAIRGTEEEYDQEVAVRPAPLDMKRKLAFLSALTAHLSSGTSALVKLDCSILSNIFVFAAERRFRTVNVVYEGGFSFEMGDSFRYQKFTGL